MKSRSAAEPTACPHVVHHVGLVRSLCVAIVVLASTSLGGAAAASCIQEDLPAKAARADAVVHARVVALEGPPGAPSRFAFVEVLTVLKGSAMARIGIALGPGAEGGISPGAPVATSVDYSAKPGEEHTLYLKQHAPGGFATDACSGSHPGAPTGEEAAYFGAGRPPDRVPGGITEATATDRTVAAVAMLAALVAGAAAIAYARRSAGGVAAS